MGLTQLPQADEIIQQTTAPTSPYTGMLWLDTDAIASGTTVRTLFIIGNGSGNYTGATTSFADFDAANWTITMPAAVGDKLRMEMQWVWSHSNSTDYLAGAFAVNGTQLGPSLGTFIQNANSTSTATSSMVLWRTVISGDLSGGNVPVKIRYKTSGTTATVYNDSTRVCVFSVTNFGAG